MRNSGTLKFLQSLKNKKHRQANERFTVEGRKDILEAINSDHKIESIWARPPFASEISTICVEKDIELEIVGDAWLERVSNFKSNNAGIALLPLLKFPVLSFNPDKWYLCLTDINDPGNFGTIIRIANWYGWKNIVCSENSVDLYNPKVISSSKGSVFSINIYYENLLQLLKKQRNDFKIYAAEMNGENIHRISRIERGGILIMGSESHGLTDEVLEIVDVKINIPSFGNAESLNVAIATGIMMDNFNRILENQ